MRRSARFRQRRLGATSFPDTASTGTGTAPQTTQVTVPPGGTLHLLDGTTPVITLQVAGKGTYTIDPSGSTITFTPVLGYKGQAPTVTVRVTDAYGQTGDAQYTPTVTAPQAPAPAGEQTIGEPATTQAVAVPVPAGGSITLLDDSGTPTTSVAIVGQGTYTLNARTGEITFTPLAGFCGRATPVRFAVTDAYGQIGEATFRATVDARPASAPTPTPAAVPSPVPAAVWTSTRALHLHWRSPKVALSKVIVTVDGKTVRRLAGSARSSKIMLQSTGPKRFAVRIIATTKNGARYESRRDYRLCKPNYAFVNVKTLRLKHSRP